MASQDPQDAVDVIIDQWAREVPELDTRAMATLGRLKRTSVLVQHELDRVFDAHGLASWEFDVLATLRRSGAPWCLAPTALFSSLMITSGTMTNRLKRLEARGLIERVANTDDGRSSLVRLTPAGQACISAALEPHVANQARVVSSLSETDRAALDQGLRALLTALEGSD
ncbi:MarR family winged helix-turn-helix transcriptional regulator [Larsenimonas rhizosphaerae]|uniref:MarR family transcriptional regulator n=1 Tax=Larsenimonas rhizosphaerae TaxID=2944682 RepID=A0AA41ZG63_9GAMM|nr:MarR family transcriptional regulator [Larsenimonas rhizosphaerae]MCM2129371.1 MarR family transcriptional regulator [Larsenimonas rhizosphaerae]MCX2524026.1 MarR family transcriptional regulator [Larsenimonas rhizosphaerae]